MSNTSPKLPVEFENGSLSSFEQAEIKELIKQNLKMILLTLPGERIMVPNFGVGIQRFLFELENSNISATLTGLIQEQISNYLPPVTVLDISTNMDEEEANMLRVKISYDIDFLNARDTLDLLLDDYR